MVKIKKTVSFRCSSLFLYKNDVKKRPKGGVICKQIAPPLPMDGLEILAKRFIKLTYRAVGEGLAPPHYR